MFDNNFIPDYANIVSVQMYDDHIDEETNEPYGRSEYYNDEEVMEWDELVETYFE